MKKASMKAKSEVPARVREARLKLGLTRADLGRKAGNLSTKTIMRIENGERFSIRALRSVSEVLKLDLKELVDDQQDPPAVRHRPLTRMTDGQEWMRLMLSSASEWARLDVETDPGDEVHASILKVCDAVDYVRNSKTRSTAREEFEAAYNVGEAIRELAKAGWLVEMDEGWESVYGLPGYTGVDEARVWTVRIRRQEVPATPDVQPRVKAGA